MVLSDKGSRLQGLKSQLRRNSEAQAGWLSYNTGRVLKLGCCYAVTTRAIDITARPLSAALGHILEGPWRLRVRANRRGARAVPTMAYKPLVILNGQVVFADAKWTNRFFTDQGHWLCSQVVKLKA